VLVFSLLPLVGEPEPTPTASNIESLETFTPIPASKTPRVSVTQIAPTVIPTLGIGSTLISGKDQMTLMYVPEGEFIMGVTESNIQQILDDCWSFYSCEITENAGSYEGVQSFSKNSKYWFTWFGLSEQTPSKKVFLDGFWMDKTEVTNSMYLLCVDDGGCDKPTPRVDRESNFGNSEFANYPVENVTWSNADTYCKWAGRRLPTEAEWEKAARSDDGRLFPWGNNRIECANYDGDVLSCPELSSPYGVLNMANFIREWTADWYMPSYYSEVILANPPGPDTGKYKVLRGASDLVNDHQPSMDYGVYRSVKSPSDNDYTGFRCARDANP